MAQGAKFDPMEHQTARSSPFADVKKDVDSNHALKCHNMEHAVNRLLEASATAGLSVSSLMLYRIQDTAKLFEFAFHFSQLDYVYWLQATDISM